MWAPSPGTVPPGKWARSAKEAVSEAMTMSDIVISSAWMKAGPFTAPITGTACETYKMNQAAVLHAEFPCEAQVLN